MIFLHGNEGLVWDAEFIKSLISNRIFGQCLGNELPIRLFPEQVKWLTDNGFVVNEESYEKPTAEHRQQQIQLKTDALYHFEDQKLKYTHKMKELFQAGNASEAKLLPKPTKPTFISKVSDFGWFKPIPTVFDWPQTAAERERYFVFKYLYDRGYWITRGSKFGAHFLLYESDPNTCHASHIVLVQKQCTKFNFAAHCRLGTQVNKKLLIAYYDEDECKVIANEYEWTGWV